MTATKQELIAADAPSETATILSVIERAAANPAIDVEKMERLLAMQERVLARDAEIRFNEALAAVQAELRPVATDSNNPQTRSRYASYAALDRALRPIYSAHGFALSFDTGDGAPEGWVRVLCHVSNGGHTRIYKADMPADGKGAKGGDVMTKTHAAGSAFTYGSRYLLKMIFNVAIGEADDDGNAASRRPTQPTGELVSPDQLKALQKLMEDAGADEALFIGYINKSRKLTMESLGDLPAHLFDEAKEALGVKKARKQ